MILINSSHIILLYDIRQMPNFINNKFWIIINLKVINDSVLHDKALYGYLVCAGGIGPPYTLRGPPIYKIEVLTTELRTGMGRLNILPFFVCILFYIFCSIW